MRGCATVAKASTVRLHTQVTDPHLAPLTAAVRAYLDQADRAAPSLDDVARALRSSLRPFDVDDLFPMPVAKAAEDELTDELLRIMADASGVEGVMGGGFTVTNPAAIRWARQHAGALITGIRDQQRQAVRLLTSQALSGSMTAEGLARAVKGTVGLTYGQASQLAHLERYLDGLEPRPPDSVLLDLPRNRANRQAIVDRFRTRLLNHRAETIARTEVERAAQRGLLLNWHRAEERGYFRGALASRRWVVTPDDRLCPQCRAMQGESVALDEPNFTATEGFKTPVHVATPPLHPRCRCVMVLDIDGAPPIRHTVSDPSGVLSEDELAQVQTTMADLTRRFPIGDPVEVRFLRPGETDLYVPQFAQATGVSGGQRYITVNADYWQAEVATGRRVKEWEGYIVNPADPITHEYGHLVERTLSDKGVDMGDLLDISGTGRWTTLSHPSAYAGENRYEMAAELFDAGVSQRTAYGHLDDRPEIAEHVQAWMSLIEEHL